MAISSSTRIEPRLPLTLVGLFIICSMTMSQSALAIPAFSNVAIPRTAETGQPIPIAITITDMSNITTVQLFYEMEGDAFPSVLDLTLTNGTRMNGTWSGEIPAQEWGRIFTCSIVVDDGAARYPTQGNFLIDVHGPSPSSFPWKWVLMGAFLAVAFIATELAFKPGIWRPTGRQRAMALEEEDRRKALEERKRDEGPPADEEGDALRPAENDVKTPSEIQERPPHK